MKVQTFSAGLVGGINVAIKRLDEQVKKLGDITVHSVQDSLYKDINFSERQLPQEQALVRLIVYSPKKPSER